MNTNRETDNTATFENRTPAAAHGPSDLTSDFDPDLVGEDRPYDASPETIAEFMAANPDWEKRLMAERARYNKPAQSSDPVHVPVTGTLDGSGVHREIEPCNGPLGLERQNEIRRLVGMVCAYGDRDQELALMRLLRFIRPHDTSGQVRIMMQAVLSEGTELMDETVDALLEDKTEQQLGAAIKSIMDQTDHSDSEREYAANTGLNHNRMRWDEIVQLVTTIIESGSDEDGNRAPALMLLLDELKIDDPISNAVRDRAQQVAMRDGNTSGLLIARYINKLRREFVGSPVEHGVQFATVVDGIREDLQKGEAL